MAVGFGISTPEHAKQVNIGSHNFPVKCLVYLLLQVSIAFLFVMQIAGWGADGVIIGSAIVRQLGEATSPEEGLRRIEEYAKSIKAAIP